MVSRETRRVANGGRRLTERAQAVYNELLAHLGVCSACQAYESCQTGLRLRRALRAANAAVTAAMRVGA